jgi:hypothetical protein
VVVPSANRWAGEASSQDPKTPTDRAGAAGGARGESPRARGVVEISPGFKATWTRVMAPPKRLQVSASISKVRLSSAACTS